MASFSILSDEFALAAAAGNTLQQYYKTQNYVNGGVRLWDIHTMLWPDIFALASALIVLVFSISVVFAYCWGQGAVAKVDTYAGYWDKFTVAVHAILASSVFAALTKTQNDPTSVDNQTCGPPSNTTQPLFPQINLGGLCNMQVFLLKLC